MAQPQQNISIQAPAFQGINSEESPLVLDATFCSRANNAVVDEYGRVGARKGFRNYVDAWNYPTVVPPVGALSLTSDTHSMGHTDGSKPIVGMEVTWWDDATPGQGTELGTDYYFGLVDLTTDEVEIIDIPTPHNTLSCVMGQIVTFANDGKYYIFSDQPMLVVDPVAKTCTTMSSDAGWLPPQDDSGIFSTEMDGDVATAGYGRVWVSGVGGDYQRIYYSSLENPYWWYDGKAVPTESQNTGGIIDVSQYWPIGTDRIVAIRAHNNMLVVFGRNSILLYGNPQGDPAAVGGIYLQDTIEGMGCIARDGIAATGNDLLFLDDTGVRSLGRSIQEQSVAIGDLTANVRGDVSYLINQTQDLDTITLSYWPQEGLTVLNFTEFKKTFVMDMKRPSSTGGARMTTWTEAKWDRSLHVEDGVTDTVLLGSNDGTGLKEYRGQIDDVNASYRFSYQSNPLTFGDSVRQKFPKRMDLTIVTRDNPCVAYARWGSSTLEYQKELNVESQVVGQWGVAQFGNSTYGQSADTIKRYRVNTKGSGAFVTLGLDADISGGVFSLQELNIQTLLGRIY
jgi:hypothetical protein